MSDGRVEAMTTVAASPGVAHRTLSRVENFERWVAPHLTVVPRHSGAHLDPGDRFRVELIGGLGFDYIVEASSDREVVFGFDGAWSGRERWSFVPDGSDTIVRRSYEVTGGGFAAELAWRTVGRTLVAAHFRLELARFRGLVESDPGPRGEIEGRVREVQLPRTPSGGGFPIDEG